MLLSTLQKKILRLQSKMDIYEKTIKTFIFIGDLEIMRNIVWSATKNMLLF